MNDNVDKPAKTLRMEKHVNTQSIVDIAAGDSRFSTLGAAVQAAGLVDTLAGPEPFTVIVQRY
jgi:uncharacterized surface protein with fasciclin (FAS1) repeats